MIFVYLIIICFIFIWSKKYNAGIRKIILLSYNYIVAFIIYLVLSNLKQPFKDYKTIILNILNAIYYAVKGIAFDRSFQQFKDVFHMLGNEQTVEIQIWGILLVASLSMTLIVISVLLEDRIMAFKLIFKYKNQQKKIVIVGNNKNSHYLIKDILNTDEYKGSVIKYYTDEDFEDLKFLDNVILEDLENLIEHNPIIKDEKDEFYIVLALNDKNKNIDLLGELIQPIKDAEDNINYHKFPESYLERFHITVICSNEQLRFNNWKGNGLDVYLISEENLVINELMQKDSPVQRLLKNKEFKAVNNFNYIINPYVVCVIGFGDLGEELLLSAYENSRFIKEDLSEAPLNALVIDQNMNELKENFLADVPYFIDRNDMKFVSAKIGTKEFYHEIKMKINELDHIFISTDDNDTNIKTGLKLSHFIKFEIDKQKAMGVNKVKYPKIIIFIRNEKYSLNAMIESNDMLSVISVCDDIYTCDNLILKSFDNIAQTIHENYMASNKDKNIEPWNKLNHFRKGNNRAAAGDKNNKLALSNMEIDCDGNLIDIINNVKIENLDNIDDLIWKLAIYEHYRWCGFHVTRGWTRLMPHELTDYDLDGKREEVKKHICIVDWDTLNTIKNKNYQLNDYNTVKGILGMDLKIL